VARKRRGTWRGRVLEILFVGVVVILLIVFLEPLSTWLGQLLADRMLPPSPNPSP
jgi:hypothetical protein